MGFEGLLGNQRLKDNLTAGASRGKLAHFYLISGPEGSGKKTLARLLGAAAICQDEGQRPCLRCNACRKVMADTHPDFITVADPEHKTVPVKLVRDYREDIFIRPNEAEKKVYFYPQELGVEGYNAMLKVFEEPPAYGVFLMLTDNPEKILPTVRSRCRELVLQPLSADVLRRELSRLYPNADESTVTAAVERSGGYLGQAKALLEEGGGDDPVTDAFVRSFLNRDPVGLLEVLAPMEKWKRDQLLPVLQRWLDLVQQAVICRSGGNVISATAREMAVKRSAQELLGTVSQLQKAIEYTQGNVSTAAVCGYLVWTLR